MQQNSLCYATTVLLPGAKIRKRKKCLGISLNIYGIYIFTYICNTYVRKCIHTYYVCMYICLYVQCMYICKHIHVHMIVSCISHT